MNSNPIAGAILAELDLTGEQKAAVRETLERMVLERSGANGPALLTNPINIGIAVK